MFFICLLSLFILTIYFPSLSSPQPLQTPPIYTRYTCNSGYYELPFTISNDHIKTKAVISQISSTNQILTKHFNPKASSSAKLAYDYSRFIDIKGKQVEILEYTDLITLENMSTSINDFFFYSLKQTEDGEPRFNRISLLFNFPSLSKTSFVHLLKQQGVIHRLSYTFKECSMSDSSRLEFGNEPPLQTNNNNYAGKCNVHPLSNTWSCIINTVHVVNHTDNVYAFQHLATFDVGKNKTTVPCSFIDYLIEHVMNRQFNDKRCKLYEYDNKKRIRCDEFMTVKEMNHIQINFEEFAVEINMNTLFVCYAGDYCYSLFKCKKGNDKDWIFGSTFAKKFELTFDYEDKAVYIKSGKHFPHVVKSITNVNPSIVNTNTMINIIN